MSRGYRELVGLQVTFDKVVGQCRLEHYYRWTNGTEQSAVLVMRGYDMNFTEKKEDILASFRRAYAPVIMTVWQLDVALSESQYLQFEVGSRPDVVGLGDDWTILAQM